MARLLDFAKSGQGRLYALVCERYGLDPAAGFSDDYLAFNLRAALMSNVPQEPTEDVTTTTANVDAAWDAAGAANEREWLAGV